MPLLAACIQFKYFSFHYTTGCTLLTFKGPIHKGRGMGTISYFMQGLASRLGFPALQDKPRHRDRFGAAWNMAGSGREWLAGGRCFQGRERTKAFSPFEKDSPPLFQGRVKYPLRLVTLGILFRLGSFCCNSRAKQRNPAWGGFKPRCERKNSFQGFLLLFPQE